MWAMCRFDLGLTEEEYETLPMNRVWALIRRMQLQDWRNDIRAGTPAAAVVNCNLREGAKPYTPSDFFGWPKDDKKYADNDKAMYELAKQMVAFGEAAEQQGHKVN